MLIFNILLLIGLGALIISFFTQGKSAIWGGATLGLIVGIIIGIIRVDLSYILRTTLIGADVGLLLNILAWIGVRIKQ